MKLKIDSSSFNDAIRTNFYFNLVLLSGFYIEKERVNINNFKNR